MSVFHRLRNCLGSSGSGWDNGSGGASGLSQLHKMHRRRPRGGHEFHRPRRGGHEPLVFGVSFGDDLADQVVFVRAGHQWVGVDLGDPGLGLLDVVDDLILGAPHQGGDLVEQVTRGLRAGHLGLQVGDALAVIGVGGVGGLTRPARRSTFEHVHPLAPKRQHCLVESLGIGVKLVAAIPQLGFVVFRPRRRCRHLRRIRATRPLNAHHPPPIHPNHHLFAVGTPSLIASIGLAVGRRPQLVKLTHPRLGCAHHTLGGRTEQAAQVRGRLAGLEASCAGMPASWLGRFIWPACPPVTGGGAAGKTGGNLNRVGAWGGRNDRQLQERQQPRRLAGQRLSRENRQSGRRCSRRSARQMLSYWLAALTTACAYLLASAATAGRADQDRLHQRGYPRRPGQR